MDLSLDDIIKTKKFTKEPRKFATRKPLAVKKPVISRSTFQPRVVDARLKIIAKNRSKIFDARDKLAELTRSQVKDAREKLQPKQQQRRHQQHNALRRTQPDLYVYKTIPGLSTKPPPLLRRKIDNGARMPPARVQARSSNVVSVPRGYVDYDNMNQVEEEEFAAISQLSRTVKNDFGIGARAMEKESRNMHWLPSDQYDLFDAYTRGERKMSPDLLPPPPPKGILRNSMRLDRDDAYEQRYLPEVSKHLSYQMLSRLTNTPDPYASRGIFANPLKPSSSQNATSTTGYRIVVSNLHPSVTSGDVKELFEDVGSLYDSRIVRPGVAEVIYKTLADAEKAVDTYHNRQLDGQPMKCLLVNPRASNKPTAPAINTNSNRPQSGKTPLEIDIDALHKVLFRR